MTQEHRVKIENGKYEFIIRDGWRIDIDRYGERWVVGIEGSNAIHSLMCEFDAARVVLAAARAVGDMMANLPLDQAAFFAKIPELLELQRALGLHGRLVEDKQPPSAWATGK